MTRPRWRVVEITAADTHALRRSVLRQGTPTDEVVFDGDDDPTTFHLGVLDAGDSDSTIVAISTWLARPYHGAPSAPARQLRGMATDPAVRGAGAGSALLTAGLDRCRAEGITLVWAHARVAALDFYLAHGFHPAGEIYTTPDTALPHRTITSDLVSDTTSDIGMGGVGGAAVEEPGEAG